MEILTLGFVLMLVAVLFILTRDDEGFILPLCVSIGVLAGIIVRLLL